MSTGRIGLTGVLLLSPLMGVAQVATPANEPPPITVPPVRIEVGGYGSDFTSGIGWWRGADTTIWLRESRWFVPSFTYDHRISDTSSADYYSFFSYANWTANFFTTQAIAGSSERSTGAILFPRFRYDAKAWYKVPPRRRMVVGVGVTGFSFPGGLSGQIVNPGLMYYVGSVVIDAEGFVNRSQPGGLWSGSGLLAVQKGREGKHWTGISVGGGHQIYRALSSVPLETRYSSVSADAFHRQWITRNFGFVISAGYQNAFHTYQRFSIATHLFFEF